MKKLAGLEHVDPQIPTAGAARATAGVEIADLHYILQALVDHRNGKDRALSFEGDIDRSVHP